MSKPKRTYKKLPGMKILPDEEQPVVIIGPANLMAKDLGHDTHLLQEEGLGTSQVVAEDKGNKLIQVKLTEPIEKVRETLQRFADPLSGKTTVDFASIPDAEWSRLFETQKQLPPKPPKKRKENPGDETRS